MSCHQSAGREFLMVLSYVLITVKCLENDIRMFQESSLQSYRLELLVGMESLQQAALPCSHVAVSLLTTALSLGTGSSVG
jgi:hypothetical protein